MHIIICTDQRQGLSFNQRRQSRDKKLIADVVQTLSGKPLWLEAYSASLFDAYHIALHIHPQFLNQAPAGAYCFVERQNVLPFAANIEGFIIYRWNRLYPADLFFDFPLRQQGFSLVRTEQFRGFSHPQINKEIYIRQNSDI